jgi:hypothetical protein
MANAARSWIFQILGWDREHLTETLSTLLTTQTSHHNRQVIVRNPYLQ